MEAIILSLMYIGHVVLFFIPTILVICFKPTAFYPTYVINCLSVLILLIIQAILTGTLTH